MTDGIEAATETCPMQRPAKAGDRDQRTALGRNDTGDITLTEKEIAKRSPKAQSPRQTFSYAAE